MFKKYFKSWWLMTSKATQIAFLSRFGAAIFIIAKILRFVFFLIFLTLLGQRTNLLANYTIWQMIFFFSVFNLVDSIPQFFLREVYRFRNYVVSGEFDYFLTRPISPLFRSLFGGSDILDIPIILISTGLIIVSANHIGEITFYSLLIFSILLTNAIIIAVALHIFILGLGILTTEIENSIMIYRDLTQMGRVPVDIYKEPLRAVITFVLPVGIMMTFPAKALMGLLSLQTAVISVAISFVGFYLSYKFWNFALSRYSSASS